MTLSIYGGPADGQDFDCSRAPRLLRVVQAQSGRWDCLDQLEDEPRPTETIHLYELFASTGGFFICPGGFRASGSYEHVISCRFRSPLDKVVRARGSWHRFVAVYFGITLSRDGQQIADVISLLDRARDRLKAHPPAVNQQLPLPITGGSMAGTARGIEDGPDQERSATSPRPVSTTRAADGGRG